jgi:hypothetical protein
MPNPGKIVNIADDGRQREVIWEMSAYPGIGSHSASGLRTGPIETAFVRSPDGGCVAGMSNGRATLYRLPE